MWNTIYRGITFKICKFRFPFNYVIPLAITGPILIKRPSWLFCHKSFWPVRTQLSYSCTLAERLTRAGLTIMQGPTGSVLVFISPHKFSKKPMLYSGICLVSQYMFQYCKYPWKQNNDKSIRSNFNHTLTSSQRSRVTVLYLKKHAPWIKCVDILSVRGYHIRLSDLTEVISFKPLINVGSFLSMQNHRPMTIWASHFVHEE